MPTTSKKPQQAEMPKSKDRRPSAPSQKSGSPLPAPSAPRPVSASSGTSAPSIPKTAGSTKTQSESSGLVWLKKQVSETMLRPPFVVQVNGKPETFDSKASLIASVTDLRKKGRVGVLFLKQVRPPTKHTQLRFRYAGSVTV